MKNCLALLMIAAAFLSLAPAARAADAPATPAPTTSTSSIGGGVTNPWRAPGRTALTDPTALHARFIP